MRLLRYLVQSTPALLAFVIAPYFFLLGATYDDQRLRLLGLANAGLSPSGANAVYRGFNIWANTSLVTLVERFLPLSCIAIAGYCLIRWLSWSKWDRAKRFKAHARLYRRKAKLSLKWLVVDTGLFLAPALGVIIWVLLTSSLLWGFRNMEMGTNAAASEVKKLRDALPSCTRPLGARSDLCSIVVFPNRECVSGVIVASTPDRIAILERSGPPTIRDNKTVLRFINASTDSLSWSAYCAPLTKNKNETKPVSLPHPANPKKKAKCKSPSR